MFDISVLITDIFNGLSRGMLFFLWTSGLTLTFSVLGIVNFAHGSFVLLGAYFAYSLLQATGAVGSFFLLIILSGVIGGGIGVLIELILLRRIYESEHLYQLLLTFSLVLIIDGLIIEFWGGQPKVIPLPQYILGAFSIFGSVFPKYPVIVLLISVLLTFALWRFLYRTKFGQATRAAAMDKEITEALGLNVLFIYTGMFGIGVGLAAFSGGLGLAMTTLTPGVGGDIVILSFAVIVIGGAGNLWGALLASLILGVFESFGDHYFPQISMALPYILMAVILILRPWGLLGKEL